MLPDRISNPGPLTYESGALPIALRGLAIKSKRHSCNVNDWSCQNLIKLFLLARSISN